MPPQSINILFCPVQQISRPILAFINNILSDYIYNLLSDQDLLFFQYFDQSKKIMDLPQQLNTPRNKHSYQKLKKHCQIWQLIKFNQSPYQNLYIAKMLPLKHAQTHDIGPTVNMWKHSYEFIFIVILPWVILLYLT